MAQGTYSYRQLMQLWINAGGAPALAPIMAAIAEAESGGNPRAFNPSGASGLWQILGAVHPADQARLFDPHVNAREAVAKYHTQGLTAWETYTNGAYKKFVQKGVSATPPETAGKAFVDEAMKFFGTPYVWGGESPKGFDCSGLVAYVSQKLGIKNVPRTSEEQWKWVEKIPRSKLLPGDLVFYAGSDGTAASPGHVAIYQGNGKIIQALETGTKVGSFPMDSAGTPVGFGRIPGINKVSLAGSSASANVKPGTGGGGGFFSDIARMFGLGSALSAFDSTTKIVTDIEQFVEWFVIPSHWVRIFAGIFGTGFVITGVVTMTRTGKSYSVDVPGGGTLGVVPTTMPAPGGELAPALGIAEVTIGAILLFVAFHNLPTRVTGFPEFIAYLRDQAQSGGTAA